MKAITLLSGSCNTMSWLLVLGLHLYWKPSGPLNTLELGTRGSRRTKSAIGKMFFPITARPRPPPGAHASLATRFSLFVRIARQRVVVLWPRALALVSNL